MSIRSGWAAATEWVRRHPRLAFGITVLLALILRTICIQSRGIWYDDAFSMLLSRRSLAEIIAGTAADTMPPLSYFLLHFWGMFGQSIWFSRLLTVLLSLLTLWISYHWLSRAVNPTAGLIAAFLLAISPFQILHAQEMRMYIMLEIGQVGTAWCGYEILAAQGRPARRYWVGLILFGILALYSHNLAIFGLVVLEAFLFFSGRFKLLLKTLAARLVSVAAFLPWIFMVPGQVQKIQTAFWTEQPGLVQIIQAADTLLGSLPQPVWLVAIITVLTLQAIILLLMQTWKNRRDPLVQYLSVMVWLPGLLLFIVSYIMRPVYVPRAMISSGVGIYLLAAVLAASNQPTAARKADIAPRLISLLIVLISVISLPYQYTYAEFPRSPYRQANAVLRQACQPDPGCIVVHDNKLSYFPAYVYDSDLRQVFVGDEAGTFNDTLAPASQQAMQQIAQPDVLTAAGDADTVWFVTYQKTLDEYASSGQVEHPGITELKTKYRQLQEVSVGDLRLFEFAR